MAGKETVKASNTAQEVVTLKAKDAEKNRTREFGLDQANKLLRLKNTQWELADKGYKWNGSELAKA